MFDLALMTSMFMVILALPAVIAAKFAGTVERQALLLAAGALAVPLVCALASFLALPLLGC